MRRSTAAIIPLAVVLAACGGTGTDVASPDSTPSATTSPSPTASASPSGSPATSAPANSAVERYCRGVDAFITESKRAVDNPVKADAEKLRQMSDDLSKQAQALTSELIANPELTERVTQCTQKLSRFTPSPASRPR